MPDPASAPPGESPPPDASMSGHASASQSALALAERVGPRYFPGGERIAFFTLLVGLLAATAYMLWPILLGPLLGLAADSLLRRAVERRAPRLSLRTKAALTTALIVGLVLGPALAFTIWLAQTIADEVARLAPRVAEFDGAVEALASRAGPLEGPLRGAAAELARSASDALPALAQRAGGFAGAIGGFLAELAIGLLLFSMTLYYGLVEGSRWRARFIRMSPLRPELTVRLLSHFREVSLGVLVGGLGTSVVQTIAAGFGYLVLGVDAPLFWALLTGVASFIPVVGTGLIYIPLALAQGLAGDWLHAALIAGYGVIVIGTVDNLARPILVRSGMQLHPLLVFLAVFGGLASFGVTGLFIGPLIMATAVAALQIYEKTPA